MGSNLDFELMTSKMASDIRGGNRNSLAKAITIIESTRNDHRMLAEALLEKLFPYSGNSIRLGISGVPGVGKSTFIETLGHHLIKNGHRVAVLTVDPSSPKTGGSILGDKTRMEKLSRQPNVFIRPSPSGGALGGVTRRTREVILTTEAAGYDVILVETVGVGQSEVSVYHLTDMFLLLLAPGGGDDLQGMKKGIVELADLIAVNKADGDLHEVAEQARQHYTAALELLSTADTKWKTPIMCISSVEDRGVAEVWNAVCEFQKVMTESGDLLSRRAEQATNCMWNEITEEFLSLLRKNSESQALALKLEADVRAGTVSATSAARRVLNHFKAKPNYQSKE